MSFCTKCGRQRNGTARFCGTCGAEYSDSPATPDNQWAPPADNQWGPPAEDQWASPPDDQRTPPAEDQWTPPADATRFDPPVDATRFDPPPDATHFDSPVDATRMDAAAGAARADPAAPAGQPDPFAAWFRSEAEGGAPEAFRSDTDANWQPTQTVRATPPQAGGYPPPPPPFSPPGPPFFPPVAQPFPPTQSPRRSRRGLFILLAIIVVLAAGGGAYALASTLGKHPSAQPPTHPTVRASTPAASTPPAATTQPASPTPAASTSTSPSKSPTPTPTPSVSLVSVAPGVTASPPEPQVEAVLSHYFHGINSHNYAEFAKTLNPAAQANEPQSMFESGYATTTDSAMTLTSLTDSGSGGLVATVTFTSHQAPADSYDNSACNAWTFNFYLVPQGSGYVITPDPPGYHPTGTDC